MSQYTRRCSAVLLLTKVRVDNCHLFTIMISLGRSATQYKPIISWRCTKEVSCWSNWPKTELEWFLIGVLIKINYFLCITTLILSKDALIIFSSLAYLSQVTWPCLLFWYISECNNCAMAKSTICKWKHFSAICSTRYNKGYISPILHNFSHNQ